MQKIKALKLAEEIARPVYRLSENKRNEDNTDLKELREEMRRRGSPLPEITKHVGHPLAADYILQVFGKSNTYKLD